MEFVHIPVLRDEVISGLDIRSDGIYVDGTLGGGGHSSLIAQALTTGHLYCFDRDREAIEAAGSRLSEYGDRVTIFQGNYSTMRAVLADIGIDHVDGVLLDIGVSSHQIDAPERGFSFMRDDPLDMRMNTDQEVTAGTIVNTYTKEELARIIREYGEERYAVRVASEIVEFRKTQPISTTGQLAMLCDRAIPKKGRDGHPAQRTFQAVRIECNRELEELSDALEDILEMLSPGGRAAVISFHSLEDRIVKECFRKAENPCTCPKSFPVCVCGKKPLGKCVNKKPVIAGEQEIIKNPRAKSAKLRIFEKRAAVDCKR